MVQHFFYLPFIQGVNSIRNFFPSTDVAPERVVRVRLVSVASSRRFSAARLGGILSIKSKVYRE